MELPLNGRFFVNLVSLTTGVTPPAAVQNPNNNRFLGARAGQPGVQVNGMRPGSNNFTVDGVDNAESTVGSIVLYPPIDAIQEFKVQTTNQEAEFGKNPGGTINVVIRGGTNEFHGNAYEFLRNDVFDARNLFDSANQPKPPFRLNQYGATFGGPLIKNRTFVFGFYEGINVRQGQTFVRSVPTAAMRSGNLVGAEPADVRSLDLRRRLRACGSDSPMTRSREPSGGGFSESHGNAVSPSDLPGIGGNYLWSPKRVSDSNQYGFRIDHQFNVRKTTSSGGSQGRTFHD